MTMNIRRRTWEILEAAKPGDTLSRAFDVFILSLIFLNVVAVIVGTVESIQQRYGTFLRLFEIVSVTVFTIEYAGRIWSCVVMSEFSGPLRGRARFAIRPMTLIDLLAVLPFYLPFLGLDFRFVRVVRLLRIVRIAKMGRYYSSLQMIGAVFQRKKEELILTSALMGILLVTSASIMYYCENAAQPQEFPDIPATLWWSVVTLTTVGYGDAFPVTPLGKFVASIIAILGIGMFALPTGILGAGFVEEIQKRRSGSRRCPHCGKEIDG
jgi:voltage-gated potassium channel